MYHFVSELVLPFWLFWLLTLLGLANLWRRRVESRRRLLLLTIPVLLLLLACTPVVSHLAVGSLEWQYPPQYDRPEEAEAIVLLAGYARPPSAHRPEAELAEDSIARCLLAARIYGQGKPCPIVATGGPVDEESPDISLGQLMRDCLVRHGVAASDVLVESQSQTTYENALFTQPLLAARGIRKIILATDAMDLPRAERCFRAQGFEVFPIGCRYRATEFKWSLEAFLPNVYAALANQQVAHEWLGLVWYRIRGRI